MDMVERVAKAIEEAPEYGVRTNKLNDPRQRYEVFYFDDDDDPVVVSAFSMSDLADSERHSLQREARARAAIEAMREPTERMLYAATIIAPTWDDEVSRRKWRAMIEGAL